jgi:hypothetical protein
MAKNKVYTTYCPICSHKKSRGDIAKGRIGIPLDRCDACGVWYLGYDKREWENLNTFRQALYLAIHRRKKARAAIDASLKRMKDPEYRKAVAREYPVHDGIRQWSALK